MAKASRLQIDRTPVAPKAVTSSRLDRLRELFAHLDELAAMPPEAYTDEALNPVCDEINSIGNDAIRNPAPGIVGLAEIAMAAQYWFRPERGSAWSADDPASKAAAALIAATFAFCEGGPHG